MFKLTEQLNVAEKQQKTEKELKLEQRSCKKAEQKEKNCCKNVEFLRTLMIASLIFNQEK